MSTHVYCPAAPCRQSGHRSTCTCERCTGHISATCNYGTRSSQILVAATDSFAGSPWFLQFVYAHLSELLKNRFHICSTMEGLHVCLCSPPVTLLVSTRSWLYLQPLAHVPDLLYLYRGTAVRRRCVRGQPASHLDRVMCDTGSTSPASGHRNVQCVRSSVAPTSRDVV